MKILIDASVCSKGGGVQVALSLINNIVLDPAFEVIFIASPQIDHQISQSVKNKISHYYSEVNENIFRKIKQGKRLAEIEKKHSPDLVFVVFGPSYWRPKAKTLQGFALPLMLYPETRNKIYRNSFILFLYQKLLNAYKAKLVKNNADYIVVETATFKERTHNLLGFDKSKIFVIENSFNSNFLETKIEKKSDEKLKIFVPTAYYPHKNLDILVDVAVELLKNDKHAFVFNFLIEECSEPWLKIIENARSKGVDKYFFTHGPVSNTKMASLYAQCDFVLLPTLAEASTAVYPEAFISKKVLLTSNLDFAVELCGDSAIYFDPYDPVDIANKIIEIDSDTKLQQELIQKGLNQINLSYLTPENKWLHQKKLFLNLK